MEARRSLGSGKQHGAFRPWCVQTYGRTLLSYERMHGEKVAGEAIRGGK